MAVPRWYKRHMWETITYWTPASHDGWSKETFNTPTTISGRWENRAERFATPLGEEAVSNALLFLPSEVTTAGWVYPGTSTASNPKTVSGAYPVRRSDRLPLLRSGEYVYKAYL